MALMPWPGRRTMSVASPSRLGQPRVWTESTPHESSCWELDDLVEEMSECWEDGRQVQAEEFLDLLHESDEDGRVELIYHEYTLATAAGLDTRPETYHERFPEYRDRLMRLFALHAALPSASASSLGWMTDPVLPVAGNEVGPYRLVRELGRGSFARVFLAEQIDLEDRAVVVKVTDRPTEEARLLARAMHPHIVPILREAETPDGLQVLCMPFLGGATLSALLDSLRRRKGRLGSGRDFLNALDQVGAPEYSGAKSGSAVRSLLGESSHARAMAWLIARLCEALDHAYSKGITHGDLKPSNVLITAEGQPMLLDFNLSTNWRDVGEEGRLEPIGTLAYLPPERLRRLTESDLADPGLLRPVDRHRADIYAMGLLLMELLTGLPPRVPAAGRLTPLAMASRLAQLRTDSIGSALLERSGRNLGPLMRGPWPGTIPVGLRAILSRCLDPHPARRYRRARDLAEDLERWRQDLPLVHARPSVWTRTRRWARAQRLPLICGAVLLAMAGGLWGWMTLDQSERQAQALHQVAMAWDRSEGESHNPWSPDSENAVGPLLTNSLTSSYAILERHALLDEEVEESASALSDLPDALEDEVRAWLLEHAWRFALVVSRPEFDQLVERREQARRAMARLCHLDQAPELSAMLRGFGPGGAEPDLVNAPPWMGLYLAGVRAETASLEDQERLGLPRATHTTRAALRMYAEAANLRPDAYWVHYRLAAVAARIQEYEIAEQALRDCVRIRPENSPAWLGLAACLFQQGRDSEAWFACQKALEFDPKSGAGRRTELLLTQDPTLREAKAREYQIVEAAEGARSPDRLVRELRRFTTQVGAGVLLPSTIANNLTAPPDVHLESRHQTAWEYLRSNRFRSASEELSRILEVWPDQVEARYERAIAFQRLGRFAEAFADYERVLEDPRFEDLVLRVPDAVVTYSLVSSMQLREGDHAAAIDTAERGLTQARLLDFRKGEAHYALGRANAVAARRDQSRLDVAVHHFFEASEYHEGFLDVMSSDPMLDPVQEDLAQLREARD